MDEKKSRHAKTIFKIENWKHIVRKIYMLCIDLVDHESNKYGALFCLYFVWKFDVLKTLAKCQHKHT